MILTLVTGPALEPVTLPEVKQHLRIDHPDEDARITSYIRTARQRLDGRTGLLGRALITQTWRLTLDRFPRMIAVPLPPCQVVNSITYVDPHGVTQTLSPTAYQVSGLPDPTRILPAFGTAWPDTRCVPDAVTIEFVAGYGDDPEDVPEPLRTAIMLHVGHFFENREATAPGSALPELLPLGYDDLVTDYRIWVF